MFSLIGVIFCLFVYLVACHTSEKIANAVLISSDESDSLAALGIIKKSNCITCHRKEGELIAPSFVKIAAKYDLTSGNVDKLSKKIITGGIGVWGEVPIISHPEISQDHERLS